MWFGDLGLGMGWGFLRLVRLCRGCCFLGSSHLSSFSNDSSFDREVSLTNRKNKKKVRQLGSGVKRTQKPLLASSLFFLGFVALIAQGPDDNGTLSLSLSE